MVEDKRIYVTLDPLPLLQQQVRRQRVAQLEQMLAGLGASVDRTPLPESVLLAQRLRRVGM